MPVAPDRAKEPTGGERFRLPRFTDGFTPGHTYRYRYSCRRCRTKKRGARSPTPRPRRPLFAVRRTILRSGKRCTGIRRENLPPVSPADHIIEKALFPNRPAETTSDVPQTSPILRNPACGIFSLFVHGTFRGTGTFCPEIHLPAHAIEKAHGLLPIGRRRRRTTFHRQARSSEIRHAALSGHSLTGRFGERKLLSGDSFTGPRYRKSERSSPDRPAETTNDIPPTSPILRNPACGIFSLFVHRTFRGTGTFVRRFIYGLAIEKANGLLPIGRRRRRTTFHRQALSSGIRHAASLDYSLTGRFGERELLSGDSFTGPRYRKSERSSPDRSEETTSIRHSPGSSESAPDMFKATLLQTDPERNDPVSRPAVFCCGAAEFRSSILKRAFARTSAFGSTRPRRFPARRAGPYGPSAAPADGRRPVLSISDRDPPFRQKRRESAARAEQASAPHRKFLRLYRHVPADTLCRRHPVLRIPAYRPNPNRRRQDRERPPNPRPTNDSAHRLPFSADAGRTGTVSGPYRPRLINSRNGSRSQYTCCNNW